MIEVKLLSFGIAKDILGARNLKVELPQRASVADLRRSLIRDYPDFERLSSLKFAVKEDYVDDDFILSPLDEVIIIPPVSGG